MCWSPGFPHLKLLYAAAKIWTQPTCPSVGEWIRKLWYVYTMEHYAAVRKRDLLSFGTPWRDLESMTLSEISRSGKDRYHMLSLICRLS